jgi:AbrB family looped-hinge helix DNA binding protein
MSYESTVTSKGQITIPKDLRRKYELEEGAKVLLIPSEEGIVLKHRVVELRRIRGIMRKEVNLQKASEFIKELRKEWRLE